MMAIRRWITIQRSLSSALMIKFQLLHLLTLPDKSQNIYEKRCQIELSYHVINIIKQINETCKLVQLSHKNNLNNILNHSKTLTATNIINLYHQQTKMLEKFTGAFMHIQHASLFLWKHPMNVNVHHIRRDECYMAYRLNCTFLKILTNPWYCNNDAVQFVKHLWSPHSLNECKVCTCNILPTSSLTDTQQIMCQLQIQNLQYKEIKKKKYIYNFYINKKYDMDSNIW